MRKTYIDNIRFITVVLVVIYHVIYIFNGVTVHGIIGPFSGNQPQDVYQYVVYPWFMLLLFVISGMSARFELDRRSEKEFIRVRTRKLLVPSTIGLLVFGWVLGYYNMLISGAFDSMGAVPKPILFLIMAISGCGPLWYIQMLWLFSMLLILVRKIEKDRLYDLCERVNVPILLALAVLIYGAARILNTPVIVVYRFGIYGLGFFIGYFIMSHDAVMERVGRAWIFLCALALIFCIIFVICFWGQSYPDHEVLDTVLCNAYAWTGTLGVLAFMKRWGNFENTFTKWMCRKSWGLYVFHYLMIAVTGWYLRKLCPQLLPVIAYLLVAVAGFGGSILLYEIISRIPVLRWCVLGIKKEKSR
ncbi:MAG: acyltransferase [Lachnospiraceae bacterium]|nr:acyltransferase [Lachnospiraceae bacterium]